MSATSIEEARWRELRARLGGFVGRRIGNPADAEDVVQDVFVRMQRNIEALSSTDRLDAWGEAAYSVGGAGPGADWGSEPRCE